MKLALQIAGSALLLVFAAAAAGAGWLWYVTYRDRSWPAADAHVVVPQGATFADIARQLRQAGVIGNVATFRLLARVRHQELDVRAGEYRFPAHETQSDVLRALISGGAQVAVWMTIPEGYTARQIAARLERAGVGPAAGFAQEFARRSIVVDGARTRGLEGFLFPSTYLMPLGASPGDIAGELTGEFYKQLPRDAAVRARALHLDVPQTVTVASLVEREAKIERDRPMIAGVIYNRLRLRMPLEIDASIEYALPAYKSVLSYADLKIDSPYNTYVHAGLPPTPIANPGLPSIRAALHPAKTNALYYVYCGKGGHVFATTLQQHQANVARCLQ